MSQVTIQVTHASAVATNGTFTAAYPAGYTAGSFALYGHSIISRGHQKSYTQDAGKISVSFGATTVTITYKGTTSLPAGSVTTVELNIAGEVRAPQNFMDTAFKKGLRMGFSPIVRIDLGTPALLDADGISASQTVTFATTPLALLNGALADASGTFVTLDVPRNVVAAWTSTAVLTVTGTDEYGNAMVEKSASSTSLTGKKAFKKITSCSFSANVSAATIGTGDVLGLPVYVDKATRILAELKDGAILPRKPGKAYVTSNIPLTDGTYAVGVAMYAGTIKSITTILQGVITGADAILTFKGGTAGTTAITTGVVTIALSGAAVGDVDSASPTAANTVAVGDKLMVVVSGTPTATKTAWVIIEIDLAEGDVLDGTFVAGVQTTPTATTGDVRGTYDPVAACDGALAFGFLVNLPDPDYKGVAHYAG